mgnify:CR=1 FL=1
MFDNPVPFGSSQASELAAAAGVPTKPKTAEVSVSCSVDGDDVDHFVYADPEQDKSGKAV